MKFKFYRKTNGALVELTEKESMFLRFNPFSGKVERMNISNNSYIPCNWCNGHGCGHCGGSGSQELPDILLESENNNFWHTTDSVIVLMEF